MNLRFYFIIIPSILLAIITIAAPASQTFFTIQIKNSNTEAQSNENLNSSSINTNNDKVSNQATCSQNIFDKQTAETGTDEEEVTCLDDVDKTDCLDLSDNHGPANAGDNFIRTTGLTSNLTYMSPLFMEEPYMKNSSNRDVVFTTGPPSISNILTPIATVSKTFSTTTYQIIPFKIAPFDNIREQSYHQTTSGNITDNSQRLIGIVNYHTQVQENNDVNPDAYKSLSFSFYEEGL